MKTREFLQFLLMMIPTLALLAALAVTLAFPGEAPSELSTPQTVVQSATLDSGEPALIETEIGPLGNATAR
jgi:hypothetical protein